ncbi:MAG: acetamidase/formamidase family protein, partial [Nitrososphaerales archaeon]
MTIHCFEPTHYYNTIGPHAPVLTVHDGDTVVTTTIDAHGSDRHGRRVAGRPNPQTGPFYVDSAEPGDTLAVDLVRLTANRATGFMRDVVASNVVDPEFAAALPEPDLLTWDVDATAGVATPQQPLPRLGRPVLPLAPMVGCFGVAPDLGQAISTATSGRHGGNMDYRGFREGVTAYFPVAVPGALFFIGDGHAVQGDGEIVGTGIEISFEVEFTLRVLKGKEIGWPRGENADYIFTIGNARPLDQAVQHATTEMLRWLTQDYRLSIREASILLGQCVEYDLGTVYDPAYTMVCRLGKKWLA